MKIRKAEQHEKAQYRGQYPLFGYVKVSGTFAGVRTSWQVPVEYLGEGLGEPNYEAVAPLGLHFEGLHTVLGTNQRDLLDHLTDLTECTEVCQ